MRPRSLVILDLDGVLVDLGLDSERVREEVRSLFAARGIERTFRPLLATLEAECQRLSVEAPEVGAELRARAWQIIDAEERRSASMASMVPGAKALLSGLEGVPLAVFTNNEQSAVLQALTAAGLSAERFFAIKARCGAGSLKPSAAPVLEIIDACPGGPPEEVFLLGDHPVDMQSAQLAAEAMAASRVAPSPTIIPIGLCRRDGRLVTSLSNRMTSLDEAGAWLIAADLEEARLLLTTAPRRDVSLSFVLLAFNEAASVGRAVEDARRFSSLYLGGHETIVVDDGSADATGQCALQASRGDVQVIRHAVNQGMGAAMRDGYRTARMAFLVHLPADRQVRPAALVHFLDHLAPERVVLSRYLSPPSGEPRRWLSRIFRWTMRDLGGLTVDFAGTYVFGRHWLERIDFSPLASNSFLFSFELLQALKRCGASFHEVAIHPFPREVDASREVVFRHMLKVIAEILRSRLRRR